MEEIRSLTIGALLQRGFHQSVGTTGRGHHFATNVKMKRASADLVDTCMDVHRLPETSDAQRCSFLLAVMSAVLFSLLEFISDVA